MDDFSYPSRSVNYFGLEETPTNYPQHGKRALSSMCPIIVISKENNAILVIGAAGGSKIISALVLAILRFSCCRENLKIIVDAPRIHHQLVPNEINYEYGFLKDVVDGLSSFGHKLKRLRDRGTIINALSSEKEITGIADYRKDWSGVSGF
jgi:gamma-glutamyltranspeptidase / glutathione hydrolase / leukotriene-C4 hydrolase